MSINGVCVCVGGWGVGVNSGQGTSVLMRGDSSLGYQTMSQFTRAIAQRNYLVSSHLNCGKQRSESYIPKGQA